jgi:tRNA nucleotidyltransferase/poly(A) polymerase
MDHAGVLTVLFEDLEAARKCATCYYGRGGVLRHTLDVTARLDLLLADPRRAFAQAAGPLLESLGERLRPGHPWRAALMLAALLHDVSKPETARRMGGRLRFFGHDLEGARRAAGLLKALRFPNETIELVAAVATHHLRPGNLTAGGVLTDKAVYRFFRDLGEQAVAVLLVCWADHASYLPHRQLERLLPEASAEPDSYDMSGVRPVEARKTLKHLQVIALLLRRGFDKQRKAVPDRLVDGHAVMKALGIPPGPKVGELLEKVREAQAEGKVRTKKSALEFLKRLK